MTTTLKKIVITVIILISAASATLAQTDTLYLQNRHPLQPKPYLELPLGAVQARGWLQEQLVRMKNGMTGNLDHLYEKVMGRRNGWLGGDGDVWERGPYWLDGLVPLAYILNDQPLKEKVKPWIEWSIQHQSADGYFGPVPAEKDPAPEPGLQRDMPRDWWPKMVMLKVLQQYYNATGDERVLQLMLRYFKYQLQELPGKPLDHWSWWGAQRGGDNLLVVYWLYNITGEKFLLDLAELIHRQTFNWTNTFLHTDLLGQFYKFHGVNLAQGLKEPIIYYQQHPEQQYVDAVQKALRDIRVYLGQPQGMFGADELTHGNNPTQGSELCTAVELMYSLENMIAITGNVGWMDHLEKIAFNALPTQNTPDYMTRQYYQQANQVMVSRFNRNFVTPHDGTDQCYGLLTGYPCCTANMHQGWPKYVQQLWMATADKGLAALVYGPSTVKAKVADGTTVQFTEETNYPFEESIRFTYNCKKALLFPLHLRMPGWCKQATILVNGEKWQEAAGGQIVKINRKWNNGDKVELQLPMHVFTSRWFEQSVAVERGPLVYALKMGEEWKTVQNTDPYGNYKEVHPTTPWNYGLLNMPGNKLAQSAVVTKQDRIPAYPWSTADAPVSIKVKAKRIPEWQLYNQMAGPLPYSTLQHLKQQPVEEITLIPYGCTTLRITEFPMVE